MNMVELANKILAGPENKKVKQVTYYFRCPSCLWGGRQGYTIFGPPCYEDEMPDTCPACGSRAKLLGEVE